MWPRKTDREGLGGWQCTVGPGLGAYRTQSAGAPQGTRLRTGGRGWLLGSGWKEREG